MSGFCQLSLTLPLYRSSAANSMQDAVSAVVCRSALEHNSWPADGIADGILSEDGWPPWASVAATTPDLSGINWQRWELTCFDSSPMTYYDIAHLVKL